MFLLKKKMDTGSEKAAGISRKILGGLQKK